MSDRKRNDASKTLIFRDHQTNNKYHLKKQKLPQWQQGGRNAIGNDWHTQQLGLANMNDTVIEKGSQVSNSFNVKFNRT